MIRRNHSFLQSLALVMRARMLGVRAQTVKVEACVCKSATKQHLAVAWLHWPNQPNTDLLHVLGLAPTGLALWCDPGSSGKRTNHALHVHTPKLISLHCAHALASPEPDSGETHIFAASWEPGSGSPFACDGLRPAIHTRQSKGPTLHLGSLDEG